MIADGFPSVQLRLSLPGRTGLATGFRGVINKLLETKTGANSEAREQDKYQVLYPCLVLSLIWGHIIANRRSLVAKFRSLACISLLAERVPRRRGDVK